MIKKLTLSCISFLLIFFGKSFSQSDSLSKFTINGYVDAYYAYYSDSVGLGNYQKFPSVSPRSNQFGLNTAQITFQYDAEKVRALATFHYGDIASATWSSTFNNIMEAHAGVRLCKKLWLDAGLFRTHVGTEGLLPKENFTSSVSVNTFYEPYFEAGVRLNYLPSEKLTINLYLLNGYNRFEDNNEKKSFGALVTYAFTDKCNIGYSNYTGDDTPEQPDSIDALSHLLIHNALFFNYQYHKLKIQIGGDYASQKNSGIENADNSPDSTTASLTSGVLSLKFQATKKFSACLRGEYFNDPEGFMSGAIPDSKGNYSGYHLTGLTLGAEYKPTDNSYVRLEGRQLRMDSDQKIFINDGETKNTRLEILFNIGISF